MKIRDVLTMIMVPFSATCGILLTLLVLLSPNLAFGGQTFLADVSPSNKADGPRVVMGIVGSCSKVQKAQSFNCTRSSVAPIYDLSVLPPNAPAFLLNAPPPEAFGIIVLGLFFFAAFTVIYTITAARSAVPTIREAMHRPFWVNVTTILGLFGFLLGLTSFFVLRIFLGKAVQDFNNTIAFQGSDAPPLIATLGSGFILTWFAYAFMGITLVGFLGKLHIPNIKKATSNV